MADRWEGRNVNLAASTTSYCGRAMELHVRELISNANMNDLVRVQKHFSSQTRPQTESFSVQEQGPNPVQPKP